MHSGEAIYPVDLIDTVKKSPRKTKHWAEETYRAVGATWAMLKDEYPDPNESQKLSLSGYGPALAALNQGIKDKKGIRDAYRFATERAAEDIRHKEADEPILYSMLFMLCYLD